MGKEKGGFLTPKAIANRIKAKGLQKLKWYCQMCQKQCRDENGFKCHLSSESHQRQLLLFAENPNQYIDTFSQEFLDDFIELLSHRFGTKRVLANTVYQEYVANRHHVHMNSTQWPTLTDFVKWLGRNSYAVVDETERGWYCAYIDKKPEALEKQKAHERKEKMTVNDEERTLQLVERQRERDLEGGKVASEPEYTQLMRDESSDEKVAFSLSASKQDEQKRSSIVAANPLAASTSGDRDASGSSSKDKRSASKRKTALEEIIESDEKMKEKRNRKDYWLAEGIVVKLTSKSVGDKYYKKKAFVKDVQDKYTAVVQMLDSRDVLKVDQDHVETVLPALGRLVLVVNGAYRGAKATLVALNESAFSCTISLTSGVHQGRTVSGVQYEDICKLYVPDE